MSSTTVDAAPQSAFPLCVDLDGTLLVTDTLDECLALALRSPQVLPLLPFWLLRGRAYLKHRLALRFAGRLDLLPVNEAVADYIRTERATGRPTVLVTAANQMIAERIGAQVGLFDEVIGSTAQTNLKGRSKLQVLLERFGSGGFSYVADSRADLAIWAHSRSAVVVSSDTRFSGRVTQLCPVDGSIAGRRFGATTLFRALRPHQWAKNILVFVPMFAAGAAGNLTALASALLVFAAFSLTASGVYLFNDLTDLNADRGHPRKRLRPLASGALPLRVGILGAPILLIAGALLGMLAGIFWILTLYIVLTTLYSVWLKSRQLVDVFILSALYSVRMLAGGEATGYRVTLWLLAFSSFLFLALALVKRISELIALGPARASGNRREYAAQDIPILTSMGVAATFASALVLALYIQDQANGSLFSTPALLWLNVPLVVFWQCRIWLSTARGFMHDDPIVYSARDWVSWLTGACFALIYLAALGISL